MRTKDEVAEKLKHMYDQRLKLRIKRYLKTSHRNCTHNRKVMSTITGTEEDHSEHPLTCLCVNEKVTGNPDTFLTCESDVQAEKCPHYYPKHTRESIEGEFRKDISDPKICGQKEPKIAVLLWMIHADKDFPEKPKETGWLKRLKQWKWWQNGSV